MSGSAITITLLTSYVISKNDYTNFMRSDIDTLITQFYSYSQVYTEYRNEIEKINNHYENWKKYLISRSKPNFISKLGGGTSSLAIVGGLLLASPIAIGIGTVGICGFGSYYFFTKPNQVMVSTEQDEFKLFLDSLNDILVKINNRQFQKNHMKSYDNPILDASVGSTPNSFLNNEKCKKNYDYNNYSYNN